MARLQITKSLYAAGAQCPKRLYQLVHDSDTAASPSDDVKLRFTQGQRVGELARAAFVDGVLVSESGATIETAIQKSKNLISDLSAPAIFEAAVMYDNLLIRVDILKNNFDGTWDLIEVKSTTAVKPEHLEDVSFQLYVLTKAGIKIRHVVLSHINSEVRFPNLNPFFINHDFTSAAYAHLANIEIKLPSLMAVLEKGEAPQVAIGRQCANPYGCEFKDQCWAAVPKGSTLELYNYRKRKPTKFELYHEGPKLLKDLKDEVELTRFQTIQYMASKTSDPIINQRGLVKFLNEVRYPIYYFDFETIAPPVPILAGMRPYQRIPVQFSCHIQRTPTSELEHIEFLASGQGGRDPREECIRAMEQVFVDVGTIIAYHDDFERSLIRELADSFPSSSDFLREIEQRFWDLEDAFHHHYYHKNFGGSVSIKKVLPFFAPDMSYEALAIKNGGQAQAALTKLFSNELSADEKKQLRDDLLTYCAQDSMAMVVIHRKLIDAVSSSNLRFFPETQRAVHGD